MRGFTIALTLVALAALSVSFFSAAKVRTSRLEVQRLTQANRSLEGSLQEARQKLAREETAAEELKEALAQEQSNAAPHQAEVKQVKSNIQAR